MVDKIVEHYTRVMIGCRIFDFITKITDKAKLNDARKENCYTQEQKDDDKFWPCLRCEGYGKIRRREDYDYMEGWKMAPWYKCDNCCGTGKGHKEDSQRVLREHKEYYQKKLDENLTAFNLFISALNKLTPEEIKNLINVIGGDNFGPPSVYYTGTRKITKTIKF